MRAELDRYNAHVQTEDDVTGGCSHYDFVCLQGMDLLFVPQWGAADAAIKVPSGENTELKRSLFKPGVGQYIVNMLR